MSGISNITSTSFLPANVNKSLALGKTYVGIDFGTSTSVVSIASMAANGVDIHTESLKLTQMMPDGALSKAELVPTVIARTPADRILVGMGAAEMKYELKLGKNIWYTFKMELGEDLGCRYPESELKDKEPFCIRNPKDAARVFFMYLKMLIERYCDENGLSKNIAYAISVPASFEANQRKDLMEALIANDMNVSKQALIDEPNAAFMSYSIEKAREGEPMALTNNYNPKVLVFDFGGGTCDISILELGLDANGFRSKNIAISKFCNCGGTDIDRYITYHYLLPRFLHENGKAMENFRTAEKKNIIAPSLYKIAEKLKERISKTLANMTSDFKVPEIKNSDIKTELDWNVEVVTNKGILKSSRFYLTNKEFSETMRVFLNQGWQKTTRIAGEEDYNSIFAPIDSAVKKARVEKSEIDYVLFIGGSAQNPFMQEALHNYFPDSEMLVPSNLQTHVSKGAAIHSLLMNGFNKCLIKPISSEPIIVITKDAISNKVIVPAGTEMPCDTIKIDDLVTKMSGQKAVELPICVGSEDKMLFNVKITAPTPTGFPLNTPVSLYVDISADKVFKFTASCLGHSTVTEPLCPFANKELTTKDRVVLQAERAANIDKERHNGIPSKNALDALIRAYDEVGFDLKAAETMEEKEEIYPNSVDINNMGVHYHNAGNRKKALECYQKAVQQNPNNAVHNFNLGHTLLDFDREKGKNYIKRALELDPNMGCALIMAAQFDEQDGKKEEAQKKYQQAFDVYYRNWESKRMYPNDYGWFSDAAEKIGKHNFAREIRLARPGFSEKKQYDDNNLTGTSNSLIS